MLIHIQKSYSSSSWPVGVVKLWHKQLTTLRDTKFFFVLMHSGIVNGYQLLCDAHTVSEQHRGTSALFLFYTIVLFRFFCICHSDSPISFLGTCIVWVNSLARTADLVLWFPDKTFDCTHPWFQNDLIVFMVPLNTY